MSGSRADRGWALLSEESRATYNNDRAAYLADATAVDWNDFVYDIEGSHVDDGWATVTVAVEGGWQAVPAFIRERPLAQVYCRSGSPGGLVVIVDSSPSTEGRIGPGASKGNPSGDLC